MTTEHPDRDARIASIVDAIGTGTYDVDDLKVADAVLERWRAFDVLTPAAPPAVRSADQPTSADAASSDDSSR